MTAMLPIAVAVMVMTFILGLLGGFPVTGGVIGNATTGSLEESSSMDDVLHAANDRLFRSYTSVVDDIVSFQKDPDLARAEAQRKRFAGYAETASGDLRLFEQQLRNQLDELTADLVLSKTVDNTGPSAGAAVTYILTATNLGPGDATGVVVSDDLPPGVTYADDTGGGAFDQSSGAWTVGSLAANASATLQIVVTVDSGAAGA